MTGANGWLARDASELEAGAELVTLGRTITEADVVSFAALTGDWHPQHADAGWAARGRFGERVAHGMLVLSYAVGLVPFDPERVVALRGLDSVAFKRPVRIGDTIRVLVRVERVSPLDDGHALVGLLWRIVNQEDRVVARAHVDALWRDLRSAPRNGANGQPPAVATDDIYGDQVLL
ncbi:MAG TPA: MaoC/PaaZ C-terminal domain-containing protein [Solirubrobacterales bacterium]|nr:MaoC/PaaZ C-terminal domain-containing protein [Solirubrobacterales bacterium]